MEGKGGQGRLTHEEAGAFAGTTRTVVPNLWWCLPSQSMCGQSWNVMASCSRISAKHWRRGMPRERAKGVTKIMSPDGTRNVPRDLFPLPVRAIGLDGKRVEKSR
eukprot:3481914-Amphidinium_carterae.2